MVLLSTRKLFRVRDWGTCTVREAPVPDIPEALLQPLQAYLDGLPGFDPAALYEAQGAQAHEQHSYATFFLAQVCFRAGTAGTEA